MQPIRAVALGLSAAALGCGLPTESSSPSAPSIYAADPAHIAETLLAAAPGDTGAQASTAPPPAAPAPLSAAPVVTTDLPVGTRRIVVPVDETRHLPVQLWYPAVESARAEAAAGRDVLSFEPSGPEREQLAGLIRDATPYYTQHVMHAADAPPSAATTDRLPLVMISHCTDCLRIGYFSIAERLAAHGFLVAATDHPQNTLYDAVRGTSVGLELNDFLEQRRLDMFALTDTLLDPDATSIPEDLRGRIDPARIGMLGHSFGAITSAYASTRDPRIRAIGLLTMIASEDNRLPYVGGELAKRVMREPLSTPAFFLLATQDIIALGGLNDLIRQNFEHYPTRAWLATVQDTGHYSVTNICGIHPLYTNGCGPGQRVENLFERFTYLNIDFATELTAALVTTFFEEQLLGAARTPFAEIASRNTSVLSVEQHER